MKEMQIFENQEFGAVRTVELDGEPWLVGKDVAQALGYSDTDQALRKHVDEEDKKMLTRQNDGLAGGSGNATFDIPNRGMTIINESGLYSLVLSSKLPGAKKFRRWVTAEVLPAIRKHGVYMTPHTLEQALLSPDFLLRLAQRLKEEQEGRRAAERDRALLARELAVQQPKIDYFNELVERNLLLSLRETAKLLSVGEKAFIRWLLENRYLFRGKSGKLLPYATRPNNECFEVKEWFDRETGKGGVQTLVTPRGRETFRLLLEGKPESGLWSFPGGGSIPLPPEMTEEEARRAEEWYLTGYFKQADREQNRQTAG